MRSFASHVDVINAPIILIAHCTVAERKSEESVAIGSLEWLAVRWYVVGSDHLLLFGRRSVLVNDDVLVDLSVFQEHVQGRFADWDHLFHDVPEDALGEWCRR